MDGSQSTSTIDAAAALIGSLTGIAGVGSLILSIITFRRDSKKRRSSRRNASKRAATRRAPEPEPKDEDDESNDSDDSDDESEESTNV